MGLFARKNDFGKHAFSSFNHFIDALSSVIEDRELSVDLE